MNQTIYPIGIQNFEKIRKDGYLYIDKTALIYQLAKTGSYYFLSRPRRFGKSLLLSTLEAYFQGKRELFEGLAMERLEKDWEVYPILHLDLNARHYKDTAALTSILNEFLEMGAGSDFYLPYFKFGIELRFSLGLTDVLVHRPDPKNPGYEDYTQSLSKLRARVFTICFNFE